MKEPRHTEENPPIAYWCLVGALTLYVMSNWGKCISMQFFSRFDGNNILFLVWILLIVLPFYDIEGKGIKVHRKEVKKVEYAEKQIQDQETKFQLEKLEELRETPIPRPKIRIRITGKL